MLIIFIVFFIAGLYVSNKLKKKFKKYSQIGLQSGLSGKEIAEMMLKDHGIYDVEVVSVPGHLSDHYNPGNKTVNKLQSVSSRILNFVLIGMFLFGSFFYSMGMDTIFLVVVACQFVITLFSLVTLPVEFDASKRALAWIDQRGIVNSQEHGMAKDALHWAAMTYVVAALAAVTQLLYFVMLFLGGRD